MTTSLGRVIARLAEPSEDLPAELVSLINQNIKPPTEVSAADVYIRAMYIVSDRVNSFGGRFPAEEHERLAELLIDSPVMVGHRKDKLPVGRNFHAICVERDGAPWVKSYFYWLRSSEDAEQLLDNIDGGIYKECSVAFTFGLPECSICGRDIRRCEHEPFEEYEHEGVRQKCHFNYRRLERVLETSLVYRGAVPKTSVSKDLETASEPKQPATPDESNPVPINVSSLDSLDSDREYLIVPSYDGLSLTAQVRDGELLLARLDGTPVVTHPQDGFQPASFQPTEAMLGVLVGYRGRARCSRRQLEKFLADKSGPVSRLVFNVYPHQGMVSLPRVTGKTGLDVRLIPYRIVSVAELDREARAIMTRAGVDIYTPPQSGSYLDSESVVGFGYQPPETDALIYPTYTLTMKQDAGVATLSLSNSGTGSKNAIEQVFEVIGLDLALLKQGRRFVARRTATGRLTSTINIDGAITGKLISLKSQSGALLIECDGELSGQFVLRPVRLSGRDGHLFYRVMSSPKMTRMANQ